MKPFFFITIFISVLCTGVFSILTYEILFQLGKGDEKWIFYKKIPSIVLGSLFFFFLNNPAPLIYTILICCYIAIFPPIAYCATKDPERALPTTVEITMFPTKFLSPTSTETTTVLEKTKFSFGGKSASSSIMDDQDVEMGLETANTILQGQDHRLSAYSPLESTLFAFASTEAGKSSFNIIYNMISLQLYYLIIPMMVFSTIVFIWIWQNEFDKTTRFLINKLPNGRIKDWFFKNKIKIGQEVPKTLVVFILMTNLVLIFSVIVLLRFIRTCLYIYIFMI